MTSIFNTSLWSLQGLVAFQSFIYLLIIFIFNKGPTQRDWGSKCSGLGGHQGYHAHGAVGACGSSGRIWGLLASAPLPESRPRQPPLPFSLMGDQTQVCVRTCTLSWGLLPDPKSSCFLQFVFIFFFCSFVPSLVLGATRIPPGGAQETTQCWTSRGPGTLCMPGMHTSPLNDLPGMSSQSSQS